MCSLPTLIVGARKWISDFKEEAFEFLLEGVTSVKYSTYTYIAFHEFPVNMSTIQKVQLFGKDFWWKMKDKYLQSAETFTLHKRDDEQLMKIVEQKLHFYIVLSIYWDICREVGYLWYRLIQLPAAGLLPQSTFTHHILACDATTIYL